MLREEKNVKDINLPLSDIPFNKEGWQGWGLSYTKTNKLITALYMVTDIIDKDEPLRNKLRTLATEILSDTTIILSRTTLNKIEKEIQETVSFLDIASAMNIISKMNCSILKKEFLELSQSIEESNNEVKTINGQLNLAEFFREEFSPLLNKEGVGGGNSRDPLSNLPLVKGERFSITTSLRPKSEHFSSVRRRENSKGHYSVGHQYPTRLGVQKGSTLLKALSKVEGMKTLSDKIGTEARLQGLGSSYIQNFEILKKQRRNDIISIIKTIGGNATIKDIKDRAQTSQGKGMSLMSCSEKTLQRELVLMVKDSVLNKVGEKRWSRYFLISPSP